MPSINDEELTTLSTNSFEMDDFNYIDNNNNTDADESIYAHPSLSEYYGNLNPFITLCIFVSALILILNISIYCTTLAKLRKRLHRPLLSISITLCTLYPIISLAALVTLLVPQAWFICHTVMHLSFTVGAIFFHRLCILYVGSEVSYIKETAGAAISVQTPPCCCCCACLPGVTPTRGRFVVLRCMVWQMAFVQGSIMMVLNGLYYNDRDLFRDVHVYFLPFIICSIILGIWGLNITVRVVNSLHSDYGTMKKMFSLQLILLLCKMQYLILDSQLDLVTLGGAFPMNHTIYKQTFINLLILVEMVLVSLLVQSAYKVPVQIEEN